MSSTSICLETMYFKEGGKHNTKQLLEKVKEYISNNKDIINYIIISSTTGYTALEALSVFDTVKVPMIVCKQDLSEKFSLKKEVMDKLEDKFFIYDVPRKYLLKQTGSETVKILRNFSQGTKVCIELLVFLINTAIVKIGQKVIVIGGTLEGADTAISFEITQKNDFKVLNIMGLPEK